MASILERLRKKYGSPLSETPQYYEPQAGASFLEPFDFSGRVGEIGRGTAGAMTEARHLLKPEDMGSEDPIGFFENIGRGVPDLPSKIPLLGTLTTTAESIDKLERLERLSEDKYKTAQDLLQKEEDLRVMQDYLEPLAEEARRTPDVPFFSMDSLEQIPAKAGSIVSGLPKTVSEFSMASTAGPLGWFALSQTMAIENLAQRKLGNKLSGQQENPLDSLIRSEANAGVELATEWLVGKAAQKVLAKPRGLAGKLLKKTRPGAALEKLMQKPLSQAAAELGKRGGFHGVPEEYLEERVADFVRAGLNLNGTDPIFEVGKDWKRNLEARLMEAYPSLNQQAAEIIAFTAFPVARLAAGAVSGDAAERKQQLLDIKKHVMTDPGLGMWSYMEPESATRLREEEPTRKLFEEVFPGVRFNAEERSGIAERLRRIQEAKVEREQQQQEQPQPPPIPETVTPVPGEPTQVPPVTATAVPDVQQEAPQEVAETPFVAQKDGFVAQTKGGNTLVSSELGGSANNQFKITAQGAQVMGSVNNSDFPGEAFEPTRGDLFIIDVPEAQQRKGLGTSLATDALRLMQKNGAKTVKFTRMSEAGKALANTLVRKGILGEKLKETEDGTTAEFVIGNLEAKPAPAPAKKTTAPTPEAPAPFTRAELKKMSATKLNSAAKAAGVSTKKKDGKKAATGTIITRILKSQTEQTEPAKKEPKKTLKKKTPNKLKEETAELLKTPYIDSVDEIRRYGVAKPTLEQGLVSRKVRKDQFGRKVIGEVFSDFYNRHREEREQPGAPSAENLLETIKETGDAGATLARSMETNNPNVSAIEIIDAIMTAHKDYAVTAVQQKTTEEDAARRSVIETIQESEPEGVFAGDLQDGDTVFVDGKEVTVEYTDEGVMVGDKLYDEAEKVNVNGGRAISKDGNVREVAQAETVEKDVDGVDFFGMQAAMIQTTKEAAADFNEVPVSTQEIYSTISKLWDIPIRAGRIASAKAEGIYKVLSQVIRVKSNAYGDIAVITHEIAHHIDRTDNDVSKRTSSRVRQELRENDYDPKAKRVTEGFAEFVRMYLTTDNVSNLMPATSRWFDGYLKTHPDLAEKVQQTRDLIDSWRNQGAESRGRAQIVTKGKVPFPRGLSRFEYYKNVLNEMKHATYTRFKDDLHPLARAVSAAIKLGYNKATTALDLARAFTQIGPTLAYSSVMDSVVTFRTDKNGEMQIEEISPGLTEALHGLEGQQYDDFVYYITMRHALEMHEKDINPGVSREDAQFGFEKFDSPDFRRRAVLFTKYNNALLRVLVDTGVITEADFQNMVKKWKTFVPMERVDSLMDKALGRGKKGFVNQGSGVRRRTGSGKLIRNPIETSIDRAVKYYQRATRQLVTNALVEMANDTDAPGQGKWIEKVPPAMQKTILGADVAIEQIEKMTGEDLSHITAKLGARATINIYRPDYNTQKNGKPIVMVLEKGKPQLYEVNKDLYDALTSMDVMQLPKMFDFLFGVPTKAVKLGATGLSIAFSSRNLFRDYPVYLAQNTQGADPKQLYTPLEYMGRNVLSSLNEIVGKKQDPYVKLRQMFGGELSQILGLQINKISSAIEDARSDTAKRRIYNIVKHPVRSAQSVIGFSEAGPRLAEFAAIMQKRGWTAERLRNELEQGKFPPLSVIIEAINASNDVTTNFKRMGTYGRYINRMVPFWNAQLEGLDKMARNANQQRGRMLIYVGALATMSAMFWWSVKDEDWYKESAPWLKYGFWVIRDENGNPRWRIPRPFEYGWLVSALTEAVLDQAYAKNPDAIKDWFESGSFLDPLDPRKVLLNVAATKPAIEVYANYDSFKKRPIVNQQLEKLNTKDQYYRSTTEISKKLGEKMNQSPAMIEHLLNSYSGGLYRRTSKEIDKRVFGKKQPGDDKGDSFLGSVSDFFLSGLKVSNLPSKSVDEFYKQFNETQKEYNSQRKAGEVDAKTKLKFRLLDDARERMGNLRNEAIDKGPEQHQNAQEQIISIARQALGKDPLKKYQHEAADSDTVKRAKSLARSRPLKRDQITKYNRDKQFAIEWMKQEGLTKGEIIRAYSKYLRKEVKSAETRRRNLSRLRRALQGL